LKSLLKEIPELAMETFQIRLFYVRELQGISIESLIEPEFKSEVFE